MKKPAYFKTLKPKEIVQILKMDDSIEEAFPCELGEWVQWLNQNAENPDVLIVGHVEDGKLESYMVVLNGAVKPLGDSVSIIFASDKAVGSPELKNIVMEWAMEKSATKVIFHTSTKEGVEKMGAELISYIGVWVI